MSENKHSFTISSSPIDFKERDLLMRNINCEDYVDHYVVHFNRDFRSVYVNKKCYFSLGTAPSSKDFLLNKDISLFLPDFRDMGERNLILDHPDQDQVVNFNRYMVKTPICRKPIYTNLAWFTQGDLFYFVGSDITQQVLEEECIKKYSSPLQGLEEYNKQLKCTMDTLYKLTGKDQYEVEWNALSNLEQIIFPLLDILKSTDLDEYQRYLLEVLISDLQSSTDQFTRILNKKLNFTSREIEVANLIRLGKLTKEIAVLMNISTKAVDYHRANIRKKLNINNTNKDLRSHLCSLEE